MKTIDDFIDIINSYIGDKRESLNIKPKPKQHLVLQRTVIPSPTFPAYKEFNYILWAIPNKKEVLSFQHTAKFTKDNEEKTLKQVNESFVKLIIDTVLTSKQGNDNNILTDLIYGKY